MRQSLLYLKNFVEHLGRDAYSQTATEQLRLLAEELPHALEKATTYESMISGWKQTEFHPFKPEIVLHELRMGETLVEKDLRIPSMSGKVLTDAPSLITVWAWRIQQLNKEAKQKNTSSNLRDDIKRQIETLQAELTSMIEEEEINRLLKVSMGKESRRRMMMNFN